MNSSPSARRELFDDARRLRGPQGLGAGRVLAQAGLDRRLGAGSLLAGKRPLAGLGLALRRRWFGCGFRQILGRMR